eukprot:874382-Amphidinium_carterae.2
MTTEEGISLRRLRKNANAPFVLSFVFASNSFVRNVLVILTGMMGTTESTPTCPPTHTSRIPPPTF